MGINVQVPSSPGAGAPGSAVIQRQRISPVSLLLRMRAYIALILLLVDLLGVVARLPDAGNPDHPGLACGAQRHPGSRHDLRYSDRGDRLIRRLHCGPGGDGRRAA